MTDFARKHRNDDATDHTAITPAAVRTHLPLDRCRLNDDWTLSLKRTDARQDERQEFDLPLAHIWLPPNSLYKTPTEMRRMPRICAAIVLATGAYLRGATAAKTSHAYAGALHSALIKFFQAGWSRNRFAADDWEEDSLLALARDLAEGGWHKAMSIRQRLEQYLAVGGKQAARTLLSPRFPKTSLSSEAISRAIGVNLQARELGKYHALVYAVAMGLEPDRAAENTDVPVSASALRLFLGFINMLFELPSGLGFTRFPYPNHFVLAEKLGRPTGRTPNLDVDIAIRLLVEAYKWIYEYGPNLVGLLNEIVGASADAKEQGIALRTYHREVLATSYYSEELNRILPIPLTSIDFADGKTHISLRQAIHCTMSAAFLVIAIMNARRKDEISHRKFGCHVGFVRVLDEAAGLYEGTFYIEKTFRDYRTFYVNSVTKDAAELLEEVRFALDGLGFLVSGSAPTPPVTERSLFEGMRLGLYAEGEKARIWFNFDAKQKGNSELFVRLALGDESMNDLKLAPHMYRRFYAILFLYRYENASLQALQQQLGHLNLHTTMIYVTDAATLKNAKTIDQALRLDCTTDDGNDDYLGMHRRQLAKDLIDAKKDKLVEDVARILLGEPHSGGYKRYVELTYARLSKHLVYEHADFRATVGRISDTLMRRGHLPEPMPHGQCMAGNTPNTRLAHCSEKGRGTIERKNAGPTVCATCPFHLVNSGYLANLKQDLNGLRCELRDDPKGEFEKARLRATISAVTDVIAAHEKRMSKRNSVSKVDRT